MMKKLQEYLQGRTAFSNKTVVVAVVVFVIVLLAAITAT